MTTGTRKPARVSDEVLDESAARQEAKQPDMVAAAKEAFKAQLPRGIHQKLNMILRSLPDDMRPQGTNKHFHYDYWSLDQISGFFRNRFAELDLSFVADVQSFDIREHKTAKEGTSFLTTMIVLFTLTDTETGEQVSGHGIGQGDDPGDKGANKAMSGAEKYWLLKTFLVGGDDTEADDYTDRRNERSERRRDSDDRDEERGERKVTIGSSNIEGIKRGGRANKTTQVQLDQIRMLAKDLKWTAIGAARRISEWLGEEWEISDVPEDQGAELVSYLERLAADDAGTVITKMVELRDAPDDEEDEDSDDDRDDDPGAAGGYGG